MGVDEPQMDGVAVIYFSVFRSELDQRQPIRFLHLAHVRILAALTTKMNKYTPEGSECAGSYGRIEFLPLFIRFTIIQSSGGWSEAHME